MRRAVPLRSLLASAALSLATLPAQDAFAQEEGGPLRFLKPWLERQLYGEQAEPQAVPAAAPQASGENPSAAPEGDALRGEIDPQNSGATASAPEEDGVPEGNALLPAAPESVEPVLPGAAAGQTPTDPAAAENSLSAPASSAATSPPATSAATSPATDPQPAAEPPPPPDPLRLAVLGGRSVAATMKAVGPIADDLGRDLARPVELVAMSSYAAMIDAQIERRVDGSFFSAAAYADAEARCSCLEPLVAPQASDATHSFNALIIARRGGGIASPADLEGKVVAIGAKDSIGARRMQLAGLVSEGIDPATFGAIIEAASAEVAVRLVLAGGADAAFAWSSLSGAAASGYSRGTLADLVASGDLAMDRISIVWRSPPIAHGPFAVLSNMAAADKGRIEAYLLALEARNPAAYDMLNPFQGGGYAAVEPRDYDGVGALIAENVDALRLPAPPATSPAIE